MPDSSAIGNALVAKLQADTALLAVLTNGIYMDLAPEKATRFGIVTQLSALDTAQFGSRAWEDQLYLVEARILGNTTEAREAARQASARIDDLLDPQPSAPPATLTVAGYSLMQIEREEFVRFTERDEVDPAVLWQRRGGQYRVVMNLA